MKKIFSILVAVILVASCFALTVGAAPSPEVEDVVVIVGAKDNEGKDTEIEIVEKEQIGDSVKPDSAEEVVIGQYEINVDKDTKYPLFVDAQIAGVKTDSDVYIIAEKQDGTIEKIAVQVVANGKIKFELKEAYKSIAFIADKKTATNIGTSDKTGDNASAVVMVALGLAVAAAVVSAKKVTA